MFSFVIRAVGIETACESLCLERSSTVPWPISFPSKLQLDQLIQVEGFVCFYFLNTASESSIKPPCFPSKIFLFPFFRSQTVEQEFPFPTFRVAVSFHMFEFPEMAKELTAKANTKTTSRVCQLYRRQLLSI